MSSSSTSPAAYDYDDIESDRHGRFVSRDDVTGVIPQHLRYGYGISSSSTQRDPLHTKIQEVWPEMAKVYVATAQHFEKYSLHARAAPLALFSLNLPEPTKEEATRLLQRSAERGDDFDEICQALRGNHLDEGLVLSCISLGTSDIELFAETNLLAKSTLTPESIRELLLVLLLLNAGADERSLCSDYKRLYSKYPIMRDYENRMPLPHMILPSKLSTLGKAHVPQDFEVKWPTDNQVMRSGGITDFFRDFYAMSVRRPYREPPGFEYIKVLVNPQYIPSTSSQPKCLIRFHGRDHPWQSKFQYLYILEDQIAIARDALAIALRDLEDWMNAEIHGSMLSAVPGAEWSLRIERLKKDASYLISCLDVLTEHQDKLRSMLKERLELNSGTRSLVIAIFASVYIPLAFVSSYFGMNASGFTDGGLTSTNTFWKISIPLVVGSIIVPVVFSGLLIRKTMQLVLPSLRQFRRYLGFHGPVFLVIIVVLASLGCLGMLACGTFIGVIERILNLADSMVQRFKDRRTEDMDRHDPRQSSPDNNERVSDQTLEVA